MAVAPINHVYRYKQREGQTDRQADRYQGCSGAETRRSAVPANIFEPERRSGKYCLSQAERWY